HSLLRELLEVQQIPRAKLIKERLKKFRRMGEYTSYFRAAISKEVSEIQELLQRGVSRLRHRLSTTEPEEHQPDESQQE
ncbi:MAG: hypothetical protein V3S51_00270, partial [Dehalococcoidia bacterium]